jgi:predicted esterase
METLSIATRTHGRVLVRRPPDGSPACVLVGCHGYAQDADDMMRSLEAIPGSDGWTLVSIQGLHRFYTRGDQRVIASWMTRQNRDEAIADNIAYVDAAIAPVLDVGGALSEQPAPVVIVGFSQGAAMAYRAAVRGARRVSGLIAVGGDIPPDVKDVPADRWPATLVVTGEGDTWFTPAKQDADAQWLTAHGVAAATMRHAGGHVLDAAVLSHIGRWISGIVR